MKLFKNIKKSKEKEVKGETCKKWDSEINYVLDLGSGLGSDYNPERNLAKFFEEWNFPREKERKMTKRFRELLNERKDKEKTKENLIEEKLSLIKGGDELKEIMEEKLDKIKDEKKI